MQAIVATEKKTLVLSDEQHVARLIGEATELARVQMNIAPDAHPSAWEAAAVQFYAIRNLIKRGKITEAAIAKSALDVYRNRQFDTLGYDSWPQYVDALGDIQGSENPIEGPDKPAELSERIRSILRAVVPNLLAPLAECPIQLTDAKGKPLTHADGTPRTITEGVFLNGKWSNGVEMASYVKNVNLADPEQRGQWERWVVQAATLKPKELRAAMQAQGVKVTRQQHDKLPATSRLDVRYVDPRTGELVETPVRVVTVYLPTDYAERLFYARMEGFIDEVVDATPHLQEA